MNQRNRVNFNMNPLNMPSPRHENFIGTVSKKYSVLVIACLVMLVFLFGSESDSVCWDPECIVSAARLMEAMNTSVDPCTDFYEYSCGRWNKSHMFLPGESNSWFLERSWALKERILQTLEAPNTDDEEKAVIQVRDLYKMCLDTDNLNNLGLKPIHQVLEMLELPQIIPNGETASNFNVARTLALAQRVMNADILIQLSTTLDEISNETILYMNPTLEDSTLANNIWIETKGNSEIYITEAVFINRLTYVTSVLAEFNPDETNATAIASAAIKIIILESQMKTDAVKDVEQGEGKRLTFLELEELMDYGKSAQFNLRFEWNDYIRTLQSGLNISITMDNVVLVSNKRYFQTLGKRLAIYKPEAFQRLIWWKVVEALIPHTTNTMRHYKEEYYATLYRTVVSSRPITCVNTVKSLMNMAVSYKMASEDNLSITSEKINEIMTDIKRNFKQLISSSTWIDKHTKGMSIHKVDSIKIYIGYPNKILEPGWITDFYNKIEVTNEYIQSILNIKAWQVEKVLGWLYKPPDLESRDLSWTIDPLEVNAYYSRGSNSIAVPAGILQTPFYINRVPSFLNYAGIGTILGHELTHGFDNEGKDYDWKGNHKPWWNKNITEEFNTKVQCYVHQYNNYNVNGTVTLSENIADNGGIKEAFNAYQEHQTRNGFDLTLPGFEHYTNEQLFFISYANVWCKKESHLSRTSTHYEEHSPHKYRIIGSLSNLPEFSKIWKCPLNRPMNPNEKCNIW